MYRRGLSYVPPDPTATRGWNTRSRIQSHSTRFVFHSFFLSTYPFVPITFIQNFSSTRKIPEDLSSLSFFLTIQMRDFDDIIWEMMIMGDNKPWQWWRLGNTTRIKSTTKIIKPNPDSLNRICHARDSRLYRSCPHLSEISLLYHIYFIINCLKLFFFLRQIR